MESQRQQMLCAKVKEQFVKMLHLKKWWKYLCETLEFRKNKNKTTLLFLSVLINLG
jgi:hypothetical protein